MKKLSLILIFLLIPKFVYATSTELVDLKNIPLAEEYSEHKDFDVSKLPDEMFYKLNNNCKYLLDVTKELNIMSSEWGGIKIYYDKCMVDLGFDEEVALDNSHTLVDSSIYLVQNNGEYYILIDKLYMYDARGYNLYHLSNDKIELIENESGRIDFVGYDYIVGYTDLGMIGYQQCEFKKVFRNGKLELDGEYKVVENEGNYPFWHYYTLVKDLKYEEYDDNTKKYKEKVLKVGTKIRALSTDAKTYITIEVEDGRKGNVKVDKVEEIDRDFIVNGHLFMNYYFLDGTKYSNEVYSPMPIY